MNISKAYEHDITKWLPVRIQFKLDSNLRPIHGKPEVSLTKGQWSPLEGLRRGDLFKVRLECCNGSSTGFTKFGGLGGMRRRTELLSETSVSSQNYPHGTLAEAVCLFASALKSSRSKRQRIQSWFEKYHVESMEALLAEREAGFDELIGDSIVAVFRDKIWDVDWRENDKRPPMVVVPEYVDDPVTLTEFLV